MICEICSKNEATIHIQEIINKQKKTINICQECAAKKSSAENILDGLDLAKFLYNITANKNHDSDGAKPAEKDILPVMPDCPKCRWTSTRFSQTGRLGCPECYKIYMPVLSPALKNMHKGAMHVGKKPNAGVTKENSGYSLVRIMELQKQLEEHVLREEFEKAACLRDEISKLKRKGGKEKK